MHHAFVIARSLQRLPSNIGSRVLFFVPCVTVRANICRANLASLVFASPLWRIELAAERDPILPEWDAVARPRRKDIYFIYCAVLRYAL